MAYWDYITNDNDYRVVQARAFRCMDFLRDVGYLRPHQVLQVESAEHWNQLRRALIRDRRDLVPWITDGPETNGYLTIFCRPRDYAVLKPYFEQAKAQPAPVP
jgi:hypothetical protein